MREDELERRLQAEQPFLVLHDEVVGALGAVTSGLVALGSVRPPALLVDREVAVVDLCCVTAEVDLLEEARVVGVHRELLVLGLEHLGVLALDRVAVIVVPAVLVHRVDEEQRQHLDALRSKSPLLVEVLLNRAANHEPLNRLAIDVGVRLTQAQVHRIARHGEREQFLALGGAHGIDSVVGVDRTPSGLLEVVTSSDHHFVTADPSTRRHVELELRADHPLAGDGGRNEANVGLVVPALHGGGGHLDLLHELPLVGIHGIEPVQHVVLVHVRGGVAQCAQRVHLVEGLLALSLEPAIDALRFIHDHHRGGRPDEVDRLLTSDLLAVLVEVVHILLVDGPDRGHHDLDVWAGGEVPDLAELRGVVEEVAP